MESPYERPNDVAGVIVPILPILPGTAVFVGSSFTGPIGWTLAGVSLAAIAGYFATTSNKQIDTERFLKVLKSATTKAVDAVWPQHGDALSEAICPGMATEQGN